VSILPLSPEYSSDGGVLESFGIALSFAGGKAVLGVTGELDVLTAPELATIVDAVIDRGHSALVLDLAKCEFLDAAGLGVIATRADRLGRAGTMLTIRSPSAMVIRLLDITDLQDLVHLEQPTPSHGHLGPEQSTSPEPPSNAATTPLHVGDVALAQHLRTVTAIPADNDVVDGALRLVVALARETVGGADGVSVSLRRHGRLATVAASDQTISDMDANQYATGEGPCVDASEKGRWFHVESLDRETRWPAFTPKAQALGINAILSSPLLANDRPVGALNIYSRAVAAFAPDDQKLAAIFAAQASTILTDAGVDITDDELASRLANALRTRQVIAVAQGVLMEREGVSEDEAYTSLRDFSRSTNRSLAAWALEIVAFAHDGRRRQQARDVGPRDSSPDV
jgi:anti-anti-sigma factor